MPYPTVYTDYPALPAKPLVFEDGVRVHRMHDCPYLALFIDHPGKYKHAEVVFDEEGEPVFVVLACLTRFYRVPVTTIEEGLRIAVAYVAKGRIPANAERR